jgi:hypothetical protein
MLFSDGRLRNFWRRTSRRELSSLNSWLEPEVPSEPERD